MTILSHLVYEHVVVDVSRLGNANFKSSCVWACSC